MICGLSTSKQKVDISRRKFYYKPINNILSKNPYGNIG